MLESHNNNNKIQKLCFCYKEKGGSSASSFHQCSAICSTTPRNCWYWLEETQERGVFLSNPTLFSEPAVGRFFFWWGGGFCLEVELLYWRNLNSDVNAR